MKNSNLIKSSGVLFTALAIAGCLFFFTSASTEKHSNTESITQLSNELAQMTAELDELKAIECEEVVSADPFLGEIAMFGGNFAPRGWAFCDGQLLPISQNTALFSLLGTTYGGDGRVTFGLPDLRGRVAVHAGNGPGLTTRQLGQKWGQETVNIIPQTVQVAPASGRSSATAVSGINPNNNVMQPSLAVNYIIAVQGTFPSRS